jgi:hypothetical protein
MGWGQFSIFGATEEKLSCRSLRAMLINRSLKKRAFDGVMTGLS